MLNHGVWGELSHFLECKCTVTMCSILSDRLNSRLTPYWFDAEWMIDCKDAQGTNMFNEGSRQSRVFYEFRCRNKISQAE